mmetsp:Transcript_18332/g.52377  ORF Transcript_18332/g.52377 Transcript_18332/m.52377 type:complete len:235 (-) Transcript_18332:106-810(-)
MQGARWAVGVRHHMPPEERLRGVVSCELQTAIDGGPSHGDPCARVQCEQGAFLQIHLLHRTPHRRNLKRALLHQQRHPGPREVQRISRQHGAHAGASASDEILHLLVWSDVAKPTVGSQGHDLFVVIVRGELHAEVGEHPDDSHGVAFPKCSDSSNAPACFVDNSPHQHAPTLACGGGAGGHTRLVDDLHTLHGRDHRSGDHAGDAAAHEILGDAPSALGRVRRRADIGRPSNG